MKKSIIILVSLFIIVGCKSDVSSTLVEEKYKQFDYKTSTRDKDHLLGYDIELFKETKAWDLAKAVYEQDTITVRKICLNDSALLSIKEPKFGFSLLEWSIFNNRYYSAKKLLECGANPNTKDYVNGSSMMLAAFENDSTYLYLLLKYKGDPNEQTAKGTVLKMAASNTLANVKMLVNAGANSNDINALAHSCLSQKIDITEYLIINCKADFNQLFYVDKNYKPLNSYTLIKNIEVIQGTELEKKKMNLLRYIREHGADTTTTEFEEIKPNN